jgi:hypothetical protein
MTIWILAVLIMASLAGLGYRQGAVRVCFSLLGIFAAALLAWPIGKLIRMLLTILGVNDPMYLGILSPLIGFVLVSLAFKTAALPAHRKIDVHFKYHAGDLRLALWERLHHRLGLCVGLFNGFGYFVIISWVIYAMSYWTVQTASADGDPWTLRLLNQLGRDLDGSGFVKVARAVNPLPETYYETADLLGIIYNNPLREARVRHYPGVLGLAERPEFQQLGSDNEFKKMREERQPIMNLLNHPPIQNILKNKELMTAIHATLVPDLKDFNEFLKSGKSEKYDPKKILGIWDLDPAYTMMLLHRARPNLSALELNKLKQQTLRTYAQTTFVATPEGKAILKNAPQAGQGEWQQGGADDTFSVTLGGKGLKGSIETERLVLRGDNLDLAFGRED